MNIILYLLNIIQYQYKIIGQLFNFICRYIPLKQWAFDDSHSPKYQKLKIDKLPKIISYKQDWDWTDLIGYYEQRYHKTIKPVFRHGECNVSEDLRCFSCNAPFHYLMWNDGKKQTQILCKVCQSRFKPNAESRFSKTHVLKCPHCNHTLVHTKDRKHFVIHKCINPKCPYYLRNLKKVDKADLQKNKYKYKLHYIYREFQIDFFRMDLNSLPKNAKPFVDNYDYQVKNVFTADETYIKIRGIKGYIWFIMDAAKRSIIGYQISDNRGVGPCIMSMRMAFRHLKEIPKNFRFIADGYSAYPLAAQQIFRHSKGKIKFDITQVIGLTNDDAVSKEFRPYKQMIERLNRTYKASYRPTNGFDNIDGANYDLALWVAYYNFLRPHKHARYNVLNEVDILKGAPNMPGKWQLLIFLGQQTIKNIQNRNAADCS